MCAWENVHKRLSVYYFHDELVILSHTSHLTGGKKLHPRTNPNLSGFLDKDIFFYENNIRQKNFLPFC